MPLPEKSVWRYIFKNDAWINAVLNLDKHKVHNPLPLLLGADLPYVIKGETKGCYLSLLAPDWSGDIKYERKRLEGSLKKHSYDKTKGEIFLEDSQITLHISGVEAQDTTVRMEDPTKLFRQKNTRLFSYAMYYGDKKQTEIGYKEIHGVKGVTTREQECVAEVSCVRLFSRGGKPCWTVFESIKRSIDVLAIHGEREDDPVTFKLPRLTDKVYENENYPHYLTSGGWYTYKDLLDRRRWDNRERESQLKSRS